MSKQSTFLSLASTRETIAAAAKGKGKPKKEQKPMDVGMFGSSADQIDLLDTIKAKG